MKKQLILFLFTIILPFIGHSQTFGDDYYSVKSKVSNIISSIPDRNITCEYNLQGIEGQKIYSFDDNGRLFSLLTRQYLSESEGETLYYGIYRKYNNLFGTALIDNEREYCNDCPKLKSKWTKNSESLILTYYSLNGESLVQMMYIRRKGTY